MSRWLPYLSELQPEFFCEVSPELAARARARAPGLGHDRHRAHGDRGAGAGHRPDDAAAASTAASCTRSGCPTTGASATTRSVSGDSANDLFGVTLDPNVHIQESKVASCDIQPGRRPTGPALLALRRGVPQPGRHHASRPATPSARRTGGLHEPAVRARPDTSPPTPAGRSRPPRKGFFTDTSICIGCKACEVACKEWNGVPDDGFNLLGSSYDNTGALGASTWRHVAFIEQPRSSDARGRRRRSAATATCRGASRRARHRRGGRSACRRSSCPARRRRRRRTDFRWLMSSDVCKHCTHAACLDVCPTGSLFRTEFGTVVVQDDICNGCGYCVPACPFGVIDRRIGEQGHEERRHRAEVHALLRPARRRPDAGVRAGLPDRVDPVRRPRRAARARRGPGRRRCTSAGVTEARLYGEDPDDGVGGAGALFLLLDEPEVYGLPPDPVVTDPRPARHVEAGRAGRGRLLAAARRRVRRAAPMTRPRGTRPPRTPSSRDRPARRRAAGAAATARRMVPDAEFTSYYGRPVVKASPWEADIPAYLFLGGLAGRVVAARRRRRPHRPAVAAPHRPARRARSRSRLSFAALVHDLGSRRGSSTCCGWPSRPRRCRSGTWILSPTARRPGSPVRPSSRRCCRCPRWARGRCCGRSARPAGLGAAAARAGRRVVHRRAAGRHRDPGLARGPPRAAVRVRRLGRGRGRRARPDGAAPARGRPGPAAGRRRAPSPSWSPSSCMEQSMGLAAETAAHRDGPAS